MCFSVFRIIQESLGIFRDFLLGVFRDVLGIV